MKHLRLAAFLLVVVLIVLLSPSSSGQSAQPTPAQPAARDANQLSGPRVDPGIVMKRGPGNGVCGSIVSYNFSPGDNPHLQSVTTCTPADAIATRRARGKNKKPSRPLFQTTEYETPRQ